MALLIDGNLNVSQTSAKAKPKPSPATTKSWENAYAAADAGSLGISPKPANPPTPPKPLGAPGPYEAADAGSLGIPYKPVVSHAQVGKGNAGGEVLDIQNKLTALGHDTGGADGVYGPRTEAAVRAFQAANGLDVDGIIGPQTHRALDGIANPWEAVDAGSLDPLVRSAPPATVSNDYAAADAGSLGVTENPYGAADAGSLGLIPGQTFDAGSGRKDPSNFEQVLAPLNSTGDEIKVDLSASVGVTGKVFHGGLEGDLSASVEQTDDGYVIKVDRDSALRLGLDVDGKKGDNGADAKATVGVGGGVLVKYEFETKEEAAEALKALVITAGDDPKAGHVAAGVENAADIAHGAAGLYDDISDGAIRIVTGGLFDNNPVGDFAENATGVVEQKTNEGREAVDAAKALLNDARSGQEISVFFDGNIQGVLKGDKGAGKLGLPAGLNADDLGLKLSGSGTAKAELTFDVDRDGNVSATVEQSRSVAGTTKGGGVEVNANGQASIKHKIEFEKDDSGRLVRQGAGEITINFSAATEASRGSGVEVTGSAGGGFSYTIKADDLKGHASQAVQQALDGDQAGALETLASVPGELKLNVDIGAGAEIDGKIDLSGVKLTGGVDRTYGTEATFTVDAENGLNGDALAAAKNIVTGNVDEGLEIIGNVEGNLNVQSQRETSGNIGFEIDTKAVDASVTGTATATDKDDELNAKGVTLRDGILIAAGETRDFAAEEADAASKNIEAVEAGINDFIDDRIPGA